MTLPSMTIAPMFTQIGPTAGGTNVSPGGGADTGGAVAASAPPAVPSTLVATAAAASVRTGILRRDITETR